MSNNSLIGPQTFRPKDAPRFVSAEITIIVCWGVCLGVLAFVHCYCVWQNKQKAQMRAAPDYVKLENQEWLDLTDRENPEFTYTL
jgi:ACS family allantoate permease-like MFS transporter